VRKFVILFVALFFFGCTDTHELIRPNHLSIKLNTGSSIYISLPKDGRYGYNRYMGSGATTSHIIQRAFARYLNTIEVAESYQKMKDALNHARKNQFDYLAFSTILAWEDHITLWSLLSDKVSVKISIFDVSSGKLLDSAIINGESGLATLGADLPQDLLPEPVMEYVGSLF